MLKMFLVYFCNVYLCHTYNIPYADSMCNPCSSYSSTLYAMIFILGNVMGIMLLLKFSLRIYFSGFTLKIH